MIAGWRAQPHVAQWWGDDAHDTTEEAGVRMWVVTYRGRRFAYAQDYDPGAWPDHHFAQLPPGSRGIDQYIGEPDMLDRGHGSAFIQAHVERLFREGAPAVGTDPHPDNARARAAYRNAGFIATSAPLDTPWGRAILMERYNSIE